jgi:signal transduction histidine kinase
MDSDAAAVYRGARETLTNVAKHACAENVVVQLGPDPQTGGVRLRVTDDGIGMAPDALDRVSRGHVGLRLLRDRVADLGGSLTLTANAGDRGTVASLHLPTGRQITPATTGQPHPLPR